MWLRETTQVCLGFQLASAYTAACCSLLLFGASVKGVSHSGPEDCSATLPEVTVLRAQGPSTISAFLPLQDSMSGLTKDSVAQIQSRSPESEQLVLIIALKSAP